MEYKGLGNPKQNNFCIFHKILCTKSEKGHLNLFNKCWRELGTKALLHEFKLIGKGNYVGFKRNVKKEWPIGRKHEVSNV